MELEREIELLKEKVKLLETIRDLNERIAVLEKPPIYIPQPYPVPTTPWPYNPWYLWTTSETTI